MDPTDAITMRGGAARTATVLAAGVRRTSLERAIADGKVRRLRAGVLAVPGADPAVVHAVNLGATLTCVTALAHHGVHLLSRTRAPHLAVRANFTSHGRRTRGLHLHHLSVWEAPSGVVPVESVPRALDVAGRCLDQRSHLVAVDSALHQGLVRPDQVASFAVSPKARREWLLAHMDGRAESVGETLARLDCVERDLAVHPQRFIPRVGRVDLVVENCVVVEIDGRAFHDDSESFKRDRRRDRLVVRAGMPVLRFASAELTGPQPVHVGDAVLELLRE
ncbi:hypothetical protein [Demequina sp.]|uniref:hypothetical protein n=1 Tax=Demequina sp. TaxID=2050685 RepID=UPI003A856662